jgi:hypothetical protein
MDPKHNVFGSVRRFLYRKSFELGKEFLSWTLSNASCLKTKVLGTLTKESSPLQRVCVCGESNDETCDCQQILSIPRTQTEVENAEAHMVISYRIGIHFFDLIIWKMWHINNKNKNKKK